jgi:hypothetical protein
MEAERRQRVERLYHAALEREPAGRAAFLQENFGGDEALRREVEEMLAAPILVRSGNVPKGCWS